MVTRLGGYSIEINRISKEEWADALKLFNDSSIYQSWEYGEAVWGRQNIEHIVIKQGDAIHAMAQVVIIRLPIFRTKIAYITWGPLWKRRNLENEDAVRQIMLQALKDEFACRRKQILRIRPYGYRDVDALMESLIEHEGFRPTKGIFKGNRRSILVDLSLSPEELRRRLNKKWRNSLTNSEKEGLQIREEYSETSILSIRPLYRVLAKKKNFVESDLGELAFAQSCLRDDQKMRISLCESEGRIIAASVCSALGNTAIGLIGITTDEGRKKRAYYLMQWDEILWAQKLGKRYYDLNGINPKKNPTVYHFKAGLSGIEVTFLSVYDYCRSSSSYWIVSMIERVFQVLKKSSLFGSMKNLLKTRVRGPQAF